MSNSFKNVLFIGPHYSLRGGMASVLKVYSQSMEPFNFLPAYLYSNPAGSLFYFAGAFIKLCWILLTKRNIKIIHLHTASRGSFYRKSILMLLGKLFGKKTVLHIHGGEFKLFYNNAGIMQRYIKYVLNNADELVCLSDEWKTYFDSVTGKEKSIVLNNPVIIPADATVKNAAAPVNVLFLNHINEAKGIFDVISFFGENKEQLKGTFTLTVAGAGDSERLLHLIKEYELEEMVTFKGWVEGDTKAALIKNCDVFILPSYNEGLPVSILEAMAYKKAVIATSVGGIPRIVKPGYNGWLMAPRDKAALSSIFSEISNNPQVCTNYGQNSFITAQDYSPAKVNEKLGRIYADVAGVQFLSANPRTV